MILCLFVLCGLGAGSWVHYYCRFFAPRVAVEVHSAYCEIFADNPPPLSMESSVLKPLKLGACYKYACYGALFFLLCALIIGQNTTAFSFALYCSLLYAVSRLDYHYRLIDVALCQILMALGLISAHLNAIPLSVPQSLFSLACGFCIFKSVYHLSYLFYQQEVFGAGDYWLIAGVSAFISWRQLPLMIFGACCCALIYALYLKLLSKDNSLIPFAPFLSLSAVFIFGLNMLG
ncbi:type 4 prepilin peptidase 1 [Mesocricetibacter intestinalis]|uniref:Type 4 prepilin peptidase 1 n=1 Tax=Mesocricetibacter intestinalis TaxID=1521930 RepID=A0A4R6V917_9PAST|nr:A24 family peptidase [Mesocricetibacter intestinalis]TDQ58141.1 type 4 prepilin peptidase 1 [Mesocricetibacter intestinalis]